MVKRNDATLHLEIAADQSPIDNGDFVSNFMPAVLCTFTHISIILCSLAAVASDVISDTVVADIGIEFCVKCNCPPIKPFLSNSFRSLCSNDKRTTSSYGTCGKRRYAFGVSPKSAMCGQQKLPIENSRVGIISTNLTTAAAEEMSIHLNFVSVRQIFHLSPVKTH